MNISDGSEIIGSYDACLTINWVEVASACS